MANFASATQHPAAATAKHNGTSPAPHGLFGIDFDGNSTLELELLATGGGLLGIGTMLGGVGATSTVEDALGSALASAVAAGAATSAFRPSHAMSTKRAAARRHEVPNSLNEKSSSIQRA